MIYAALLLAACLGTHAGAQVVINEIHFDPEEGKRLEFVELHNASNTAADVSGWKLDRFTIPTGTVISPRGFLVLAQDPAELEKTFGVKALGPLPGKLKNGGEKLTLMDAAGNVREQFSYGAGFPWPSATLGTGASLERLHPNLDVTRPGHWRASGSVLETRDAVPLFIPAGSTQWRWQKGDKPQPAAWRGLDFSAAQTWPSGKAGFGYGDEDDVTTIADMQGRYASLYLRHTFKVEKVPAALQLRIRVDDGAILWLNGEEIARLHMPSGELGPQTLAQEHEAEDWEVIPLPDAARHLRNGENVLAVQVFNSALDSSDLSFDAELSPPTARNGGKLPTPGAVNSTFVEAIPPACEGVTHLPIQPRPGEPVKVTAILSPGSTATSAVLHAQFIEPGGYIRKKDSAFETQWQLYPMQAEGSVWTVTIPGTEQKNRRLTRYRVTLNNANGSVRLPYTDDPSPNFAFYTWAGPPPLQAALVPGKSPAWTFSSEFQRTTLPGITLIANGEDVSRSQWDGNFNQQRMQGTLVSGGRVFDHIEFKNRGSGSTYNTGKNKWGFRFPKAREMPLRDPWGKPYSETWNGFAMNACASPWVQVNRGMAGLDEAVSFRCYQLAGVPASDTLPVQFRVVTRAEEQGPTQFETDLWGLYLAIEDVDNAFLENKGLPEGVLFTPEKGLKHSPAGVDGQAMWNSFAGGPKGDAAAWWRANMDVDTYYSFHAINRLVGNVDIRPGANHHFYRHPQRGWIPIPWDLDMQFIPRTHQPGYIDQARCLEVPQLRREYQNRAREILDLLASDPRPDGGQIGQVIEEYARRIEPRARGLASQESWANLDAALWNQHPRSNNKGAFFRQEVTESMFGGPFTRKLATPDFAGFLRYALEYMTDSRPQKNYAPNDGNWLGYGWGYLAHEARDTATPARPSIRYLGPEGFPRASLHFAASAYQSGKGGAAHAATQWRIASITRLSTGPWHYEIQPVWQSAPLPPSIATCQIPGGILRAGHTYRARVRQLDAEGRWSHWSEAVQFVPR